MSDKKAKIMILISAVFLIAVGITLYYVFNKQGYSNRGTNKIVNYKINDYIETEPIAYSNYSDVFSNVSVSRIKFKQLDNSLVNDYLINESELIDYIDKYYNEIKKNENYNSNNTVLTTIKTQINSAILSVFYEMEFNINGEIKCYFITLNIDLQTNKIISNDDLLSKYNYSKSYISEKIFNDAILISNNEIVIDKNTNISLNRDDIFRKKDKYVERITSDFNNIIYMYIENESLAIVYDTKILKEMFYNTDINSQISVKYLK